MATNLASGQICQVRVVCADSTSVQAGINIMHFLVGTITGGVMTDAQAVAIVDASLATVYKPWINNNATYRGAGVKILTPTQQVEAVSTTHAGAGTGGANALPQQSSGLVKFLTAQAGRNYRGRIYPPFPPTGAANSDGAMTGGAATGLQNIGNAWLALNPLINGPVTVVFIPVIYHRAPPALKGTTTPILSALAVQDFATQRRRGQLGRTNIPPF